MTFKRSRNVVVNDKRLSLTQAFGLAAGILAVGALAGAAVTKSVVQETVEVVKEVPVTKTVYRDLPENVQTVYVIDNPFSPERIGFNLVSGNCQMKGNMAWYIDTPAEAAPVLEKLRKAIDSEDPRKALSSIGDEINKNVAKLRLECVKP